MEEDGIYYYLYSFNNYFIEMCVDSSDESIISLHPFTDFNFLEKYINSVSFDLSI
jgi:hypothetical protein